MVAGATYTTAVTTWAEIVVVPAHVSEPYNFGRGFCKGRALGGMGCAVTFEDCDVSQLDLRSPDVLFLLVDKPVDWVKDTVDPRMLRMWERVIVGQWGAKRRDGGLPVALAAMGLVGYFLIRRGPTWHGSAVPAP